MGLPWTSNTFLGFPVRVDGRAVVRCVGFQSKAWRSIGVSVTSSTVTLSWLRVTVGIASSGCTGAATSKSACTVVLPMKPAASVMSEPGTVVPLCISTTVTSSLVAFVLSIVAEKCTVPLNGMKTGCRGARTG